MKSSHIPSSYTPFCQHSFFFVVALPVYCLLPAKMKTKTTTLEDAISSFFIAYWYRVRVAMLVLLDPCQGLMVLSVDEQIAGRVQIIVKESSNQGIIMNSGKNSKWI